MVGVGLIRKVNFERRLEGGEGASHPDIWRKSVLDGGNSPCRAQSLACFRESRRPWGQDGVSGEQGEGIGVRNRWRGQTKNLTG